MGQRTSTTPGPKDLDQHMALQQNPCYSIYFMDTYLVNKEDSDSNSRDLLRVLMLWLMTLTQGSHRAHSTNCLMSKNLTIPGQLKQGASFTNEVKNFLTSISS